MSARFDYEWLFIAAFAAVVALGGYVTGVVWLGAITTFVSGNALGWFMCKANWEPTWRARRDSAPDAPQTTQRP